MWSWNLVLWGIGFFGETHGWVVARVAEASAIAGSVVGYLVAANLVVQILAAVAYIAIGVWFFLHGYPAGIRVFWYYRVDIAVLWLAYLTFVPGFVLVMLAYAVGVMAVFSAGAIGLVLFPYEAVIRGVLALLVR